MYAKSTRRSAKREVQEERSATIKSRALGALKLASEASCARRECAREAGRFLPLEMYRKELNLQRSKGDTPETPLF